MAKAIRVYTKFNRADQPGTMIGVRVQPPQLAQLDAWIALQPEPLPTRPEAIRQLLTASLSAEQQATEADG